MREIPLTQGKVALVDDADFERVNQHTWHAHKNGRRFYAESSIAGKVIALHHFLLGKRRIDHVDGNGLNNTCKNLRPGSRSQNGRAFRQKMVGKTSQYFGVSWHKPLRKWRASIWLNGGPVNLGCFVSEVRAARAYNRAAVARDPVFNNLNKV